MRIWNLKLSCVYLLDREGCWEGPWRTRCTECGTCSSRAYLSNPLITSPTIVLPLTRRATVTIVDFYGRFVNEINSPYRFGWLVVGRIPRIVFFVP